ncbi:MAG TPA: uridine kinase [Polyangiaceae bacterium]|jgi:uridine kinase|nr:uridine kinase [Polyangiaceae bacterium]
MRSLFEVGSSRSLLLGIAGGTGSGKSTLASKIGDALDDHSTLISHDWYYLDRSGLSAEQRESINYDEPGALDNELLCQHLDELKQSRPVECPQYDFTTHTRKRETISVPARHVVVVEGILLFAVPELRDRFDLRLYVDTDDDIRLMRRLHRDLIDRGRDLKSVEQQYYKSVRPMHLLHVAPSKQFAHLVVPEGGQNAQALDVIVGRLRYLLDGA